jgi:hypothetical protein
VIAEVLTDALGLGGEPIVPLGSTGQPSDLGPPGLLLGRPVVSSGDGRLDDAFEQAALAAKGQIDGLGGDARAFGDRCDGGSRVPVVDEES